MRDLARLVIEVFHKPAYVIGYTAMMLLLGLHLRHGMVEHGAVLRHPG